jgi:hypothetical protein
MKKMTVSRLSIARVMITAATTKAAMAVIVRSRVFLKSFHENDYNIDDS